MGAELIAARTWAKDHGVKYATTTTETVAEETTMPARKFGSTGMN
jgi:hypothetical protein